MLVAYLEFLYGAVYKSLQRKMVLVDHDSGKQGLLGAEQFARSSGSMVHTSLQGSQAPNFGVYSVGCLSY